jgi:hypothetical protein
MSAQEFAIWFTEVGVRKDALAGEDGAAYLGSLRQSLLGEDYVGLHDALTARGVPFKIDEFETFTVDTRQVRTIRDELRQYLNLEYQI